MMQSGLAARLFVSLGVASLALGLPAVPANAGFRDGNELFNDCSADRGRATFYQDYASCVAYVQGVLDFLVLTRSVGGEDQCIPPNVTAGQAVDVVKKFLNDHPEFRHMEASLIVLAAVREAWGCSLPSRD